MRVISRSLHSARTLRGALTSKPYAFVARPWELTTVDGVDNLGSLGANTQLQFRGNELMRVLPRTNDEINDDWIDDKTRFSYDGLKVQRLIKPLCRDLENPKLWDKSINTWKDAFARIKSFVDQHKGVEGTLNFRTVIGSSTDLYTALALADLTEMLSRSGDLMETTGSRGMGSGEIPSNYRFNSSIFAVEEADTCLLVGTNLIVDAPLLGNRLRKTFLKDLIRVAQIGFENGLPFPAEQLGLSLKTLEDIVKEKHAYFEVLKSSKKPMIVLDSSIFDSDEAESVEALLQELQSKTKLVQRDEKGVVTWNGINVFHRRANDVGFLELGKTKCFSSEAKKTDLLFLMHVQKDDLPFGNEDLKKLRENSEFIVYQGSHGDELAAIADVVLPGASFHEKNGIYTNVEGRSQLSFRAIAAPGLAKQDWTAVRALSEVLGVTLPYDSEKEIHDRLERFVPGVGRFEEREAGDLNHLQKMPFEVKATQKKAGNLRNVPLLPQQGDFYLDGHASSRVSKVMAQCSMDEVPLFSNFIN